MSPLFLCFVLGAQGFVAAPRRLWLKRTERAAADSDFGYASVTDEPAAPGTDEWSDFRVVKIPANREELIFSFMQFAKCERLEAQDEVDAFLASSAKREYWRQIQQDEKANPMPQPPTNAQKIFFQVRQVVRFGLFIAAGYYVGGPIRDFLVENLGSGDSAGAVSQ